MRSWHPSAPAERREQDIAPEIYAGDGGFVDIARYAAARAGAPFPRWWYPHPEGPACTRPGVEPAGWHLPRRWRTLVETLDGAGRSREMRVATRTPLSHRDRAVLRAVADGRCRASADLPGSLLVDGLRLADQFAGTRLAEAGLLAAPFAPALPIVLTAAGRAMLDAA